jgi:hypothetical protein
MPYRHVPLSVALALAASAALLSAWLAPPRAASATPAAAQTHLWRQFVRIEEDYPFTVPAGKVLVVQSAGYGGKGDGFFSPQIRMIINGEVKLILSPTAPIEPGWVVESETRVDVRQPDPELKGYLFGYLADA